MKILFYISAFAFSFYIIPAYPQWIEQTLPGDIAVTLGIDFINQNHGVMGGWHFNSAGPGSGDAFFTTNSGTNWIESTIPDSMRVLIEVKLFNNNLGYGVGAYNLPTINLNKNKSIQMKNLHPFVKRYYENIGINFESQEEYRGYFVETTDGGLNWYPKGTFEDSVHYLVGMHFFNTQTGFVLAYGPAEYTPFAIYCSAILKTTNSGSSWNYVYAFEKYLNFSDIIFFDQMNGIVVGTYDDMINSYGVVLRTTDGGNNWEKIFITSLAAINKVTYLNSSTILICGNNNNSVSQGVVYKSTDGGINWQEFKNYGLVTNVYVIDSFLGSEIILICGVSQQTGIIIPFTDISFDNGLTWQSTELSGFQNYFPLNSEIVDYSRWYLSGTKNTTPEGFVLFTDNAGGVPVELISFSTEVVDGKINLSWTTATELNNLGFEVERKSDNQDWRAIGFIEGKGTTTETQNYNFIDDLFGVADSKIFYRLKQIDFNGSFDYSKEIEVVRDPASFSLEQNYPNPFNPSTKIKFTIPLVETTRRVVFTTLKIYDILGNEIATLVNEEKSAGMYEVEFDGTGLPSGIYFYKLKAGGYIETKKMVLIK